MGDGFGFDDWSYRCALGSLGGAAKDGSWYLLSAEAGLPVLGGGGGKDEMLDTR